MTELRTAVKRRTVDVYDHRGRRLVVMLEPGDVIAVREERTRKWFRAPLTRVYRQIVVWNVDAERAAKRERRKIG